MAEVESAFDSAGKDEMRAEALHLAEVLKSFQLYARHSFEELSMRESQLKNLKAYQKNILMPTIEKRLRRQRECVVNNHKLLQQIVKFCDDFIHATLNRSSIDLDDVEVSASNRDKINSTLRQCMRDWTTEGETERFQTYSLILDDLETLYPDVSARNSISVLTPGAGLGRLTWEIARANFTSQGNEFSYFMLLASQYILNSMSDANPIPVHPFVLQTSNVLNFNDSCRELLIPDVDPNCLGPNSRLSMVAGEFIEVYRDQHNSWDVVVTNFFIDTARNIADYIEVFRDVLKPGGYWINLGPLLYHYADMPNESSIELSYEEVKLLLEPAGLKMIV